MAKKMMMHTMAAIRSCLTNDTAWSELIVGVELLRLKEFSVGKSPLSEKNIIIIHLVHIKNLLIGEGLFNLNVFLLRLVNLYSLKKTATSIILIIARRALRYAGPVYISKWNFIFLMINPLPPRGTKARPRTSFKIHNRHKI